ncbi:hypothetical protein ACWEPZ_35695 [Streptomyces sp. NPDC004288]
MSTRMNHLLHHRLNHRLNTRPFKRSSASRTPGPDTRGRPAPFPVFLMST